MRYFLDTEFNGFGGKLISLALVGENGDDLYIATHIANPVDWVKENVIPILSVKGARPSWMEERYFCMEIADFLRDDESPVIIADWPDDIKHFCETLIIGPGEMAPIESLQFEMVRVDAYPTSLYGAVRHNALWDARALRHLLLDPARHQ